MPRLCECVLHYCIINCIDVIKLVISVRLPIQLIIKHKLLKCAPHLVSTLGVRPCTNSRHVTQSMSMRVHLFSFQSKNMQAYFDVELEEFPANVNVSMCVLLSYTFVIDITKTMLVIVLA